MITRYKLNKAMCTMNINANGDYVSYHRVREILKEGEDIYKAFNLERKEHN
jgi:hypothetical protein